MRIAHIAAVLLALLFAPASLAADGGAPKPGDIFRDCPECPELVAVPAGTFLMGSTKGRKRGRPVKRITLARPFAIGRYEVTFDEWNACLRAGGCKKKPFDRAWGRGRRPVINITFADMQGYLAWISKKTGHVYRLPSEAEWEYAARAGTTTEFWWGDKMIPGTVNCYQCGTKWSGVGTAPVGTFKPNPWGLYDAAGNVLEFVSDCWHTDHVETPTDGTPYKTRKCQSRIMKGGSWYYKSKVARPAARVRNDVRVAGYFISFRVLRELAPPRRGAPAAGPRPVSP